MIELVLVRHAKSDWGDPALRDHDRPLNARGRSDAPVMAKRLAASGFRPGRILSSTAVRARSTAEEFGAALGVPVEQREELYASSARTLQAAASASGASALIVVAHNPGITALAEELSCGGISHLPTCAVARFVWESDDWDVATSIDPATWELMTPR